MDDMIGGANASGRALAVGEAPAQRPHHPGGGATTYVPLGGAANTVLLSEDQSSARSPGC
jgi:hypothetical protein